MKLGSVGRSGRLCGAVTAVVAALTAVASVSWVAQTAEAVQSQAAIQWVSPPPQQVLRPANGEHTFVVSAGPGTSLTWSGRGATCHRTTGFTAECRVRDRSRGGTVRFTATGPSGAGLTASTRVVQETGPRPAP